MIGQKDIQEIRSKVLNGHKLDEKQTDLFRRIWKGGWKDGLAYWKQLNEEEEDRDKLEKPLLYQLSCGDPKKEESARNILEMRGQAELRELTFLCINGFVEKGEYENARLFGIKLSDMPLCGSIETMIAKHERQEGWTKEHLKELHHKVLLRYCDFLGFDQFIDLEDFETEKLKELGFFSNDRNLKQMFEWWKSKKLGPSYDKKDIYTIGARKMDQGEIFVYEFTKWVDKSKLSTWLQTLLGI